MAEPDNGRPIPEERRRDIFRALVEAQDQQMTVAQSRAAVAETFGITGAQLREIEREGLQNTWPPL